MMLSTGPWWCAPVLASGSMSTVPAHSFSAPARAVVIAAARVMPGVCGVLGSSSPARTTRTPLSRQSVIATDCDRERRVVALAGVDDREPAVDERVGRRGHRLQREEPAAGREDLRVREAQVEGDLDPAAAALDRERRRRRQIAVVEPAV